MNLNALEIQRKGLRASVALVVKEIETEFSKSLMDFDVLSNLKIQIVDKLQRLDHCQNQISVLLLQEKDGDVLFYEDFKDSEVYRDQYVEICFKIEQILQECTSPKETETQKFKLIEVRTFGGEPKDFLSFWSSFQQIHDDKTIGDEYKMQYLLRFMVPNSKAEQLVMSFPATAANYSKAIEQLKERFGRDDLLIQFCVRDLLNLVRKNAAAGGAKTDLASLYYELEEKLRALDSLGIMQEQYNYFLTPLIESCLPEKILLTWKRSQNLESYEIKSSRSLEHLMNFLLEEVQGKDMVLPAQTICSSHPSSEKRDIAIDENRQVDSATTLALEMVPANSLIVNCDVISDAAYTVYLRAKCASKEEFKLWLAEHMKLSGVTYRVAATKPRTGKTVIFKAVYRCQHNTYPSSHLNRVKHSKKNTDCPAKLNVTIKSPVEGRIVRSQDYLRAEYPTLITIIHNHNHLFF